MPLPADRVKAVLAVILIHRPDWSGREERREAMPKQVTAMAAADNGSAGDSEVSHLKKRLLHRNLYSVR